MIPLRSLAHPEWPYEGTAHEWRGFIPSKESMDLAKDFTTAFLKRLPADATVAEILEAIDDMTIYQKQNFGPELK